MKALLCIANLRYSHLADLSRKKRLLNVTISATLTADFIVKKICEKEVHMTKELTVQTCSIHFSLIKKLGNLLLAIMMRKRQMVLYALSR